MIARSLPSTNILVLWALLASALTLPAVLFGAVAWQSRSSTMEEAGQRAERTLLILHLQAQNVFETYDLMMDRIADRVRERSWEELRTAEDVHVLLKDLARAHPQIGTALLFDAEGTAQASSVNFPTTPVNVADRDYWRAFQAGHRGTFIGETVRGRTTGNLSFNVARPLFDGQGALRGAIVLAAYPSYFAQIYERTLPGLNYSAGLVREDGIFLIRDAETRTSNEQPRASANFMRARERAPEGRFVSASTVDGIERIVAYKKLPKHPIYVIYALSTEAVLAGWRRQMRSYALIIVPVAAGLVAMTAFALMLTRREQSAARQLREEMSLRSEAEQKLRDAQKMEALGQLTGGIAHDFNNLLTVVMGNLDLLKRAREDRRPRLLANALHAVEQGRKLTSQLLTFGRRATLHPEVVDLHALVSSMPDMLQQSLRGDIHLRLDLHSGLWPVVVDKNQFQIALINLAANARDAMPKGGELSIQVRNAVHGDRETVLVALSDTGVGIPSEALSRVFEPFFTTKPVGKGTGLGLAQVYGFARQSGGSVDIQSEEGRGTTVTLSLPRAQPTTTRATENESRGPLGRSGRPLNILLVEDNDQVAEVVADLLVEDGHHVTHASNAPKALSLLETSADAFDVILSDLVMPGDLNGLDLARTVRQRWPRLSVLLATGYSEFASDAEQEGFALLRKPYQPEALAEALQNIAPVSDTVVRLRG